MRSLLLLAPVALAGPLLNRRYDLDGNGVPDMCKELGNGYAECMEGGQWTTVPSTMSATGAAPAAASSTLAVADSTHNGGSSKPAATSLTSAAPSAVQSSAAASSSKAAAAAASLPSDVNQFRSDKGNKWTMEVMPGTNASQNLGAGAVYSNTVNRLGWDKGRTSSIDGKVFWNFGDCSSVDGLEKGAAAGWSMGAAFYGSVENPLEVDMTGFSTVSGNDFAQPWTGSPNPDPALPQGDSYGMDTSNTAQVSNGTGIGFAWEIWRSSSVEDIKDLGSAMFEVTLGAQKPIATRHQGLITDGSKIQIGMMTIFNPNIKNTPGANGYIYMYSNGNGTWDSIIVGRVKQESAFDPTKYQFMMLNGTWDAEGKIPVRGDATYGMQGKPVSNNQGSIMWNDYLQKYTLFCGTLGSSANFHTADNPWGPWSDAYVLLDSTDGMRYGANVHPDLLPSSNGKELLFSWGTAGIQTMYKITLNY